MHYHETDCDLSESIVGYVWDELVEANEWSVCKRYLTEPVIRYENALHKFDVSMKICSEDEALGGEEFERQIVGWYVRDVSNLLLVLKNVGQLEKHAEIMARAIDDMRSRNGCNLIDAIRDRAAI